MRRRLFYLFFLSFAFTSTALSESPIHWVSFACYCLCTCLMLRVHATQHMHLLSQGSDIMKHSRGHPHVYIMKISLFLSRTTTSCTFYTIQILLLFSVSSSTQRKKEINDHLSSYLLNKAYHLLNNNYHGKLTQK